MLSQLVDSKAVHVRDPEGDVGFLMLSHMPTTLEEIWPDFADLLAVLFQGEFFPDNSKRPKYNFNAYHFHIWNRFSLNVSDSAF